MKILALVTARGGSKRIPKKNLRKLGGDPLILHSIRAIHDVEGICDILVSTDDQEIADICIKAGALVPWLRPAILATDEASSVDVALHALDWYESEKGKVDGLLLLQPTSPFRTEESVRQSIKIFTESGGLNVLAVSPVRDHPYHMLTRKEDGYLAPIGGGSIKKFSIRSQLLPLIYRVNGAIYLVSPNSLRNKNSFIDEFTLPIIIDSEYQSIDIDTEWDWAIAEIMHERCQLK